MVDHDAHCKVELVITCTNLPDMDTFSKSDPFCAVFALSNNGSKTEIGRTETIMNDLNPTFQKRFIIDYYFEEVQDYLFQVYDEDTKSRDLSKHDFCGQAKIRLSEIVASPGQVYTTNLIDKAQRHRVKGKNKKKPCTITIKCTELNESKENAIIVIEGEKLDKMDWFGKSDPYLVFYRIHNNQDLIQVYKTETKMKTLNPKFKKMEIPLRDLCNGDHQTTFVVKCFDWNKSGSPDLIGQFSTSIANCIEQKTPSFTLVRPAAKKNKDKKKPHGTIHFTIFEVVSQPSFMEFIRGGMEISLMVAIDFTGSNGNPADRNSLHYRGGDAPNEYLQAIRSVGSVLSAYDSDNMFPVWGFGAKINGRVSHCFPLTFDQNNIEVQGVEGIVNVYNNSFRHGNLLLSGPTYFSEIIQTAHSIASASAFNSSDQGYYILLIITDGIINDMANTIRSLVNASTSPLSVIIVGVGRADFSAMEVLDADDEPLVSNGVTMARDIVQFVPFRDFKSGDISRLAAETLAEVPGQVLDFAKLKKVQPKKAREAVFGQMNSQWVSQSALDINVGTEKKDSYYPGLPTISSTSTVTTTSMYQGGAPPEYAPPPAFDAPPAFDE